MAESEKDILKDSSDDMSEDVIVKKSSKKKTVSLTKKIKKRPLTEEQVKEWFVQNNLNMDIFEYFSPCNGEILKQLYEMKSSAPEFYYKAMHRIEENCLRSIVLFTARLSKLYASVN